jgi:uncharacterized coiled-coil protein SlyX
MNLFRSKTTIPRIVKCNKRALLLIPLVLACFALLPRAQAVTPELLPAPPPDGAYTGFNTAEGLNALFNLTTGQFDTALGFNTLKSDTTGGFNTAVGAQALLHNNGSNNTAVGVNALVNNTTGTTNTAVGQGTLASNTTGFENTATGFQALAGSNSVFNTANGAFALWKNTTGSDNTANGDSALFFNTTGSLNTAIGEFALGDNTRGRSNTAIGAASLDSTQTGNDNTASGYLADALLTTGSNNIALGSFAGYNLTMGSNNIDIGNLGVAAEDNTIRIGTQVAITVFGIHAAHTRTFIAGIRGRTTGFANAVPVVIDSAGQLGTASSSRRFKNEIKPMDKTSEAILALKPVTFHYKSDSTGIPQFGLIAEEVAKVNPDLVVRDENGEFYTVRYDAVNAMLLNEFLKEHRKVQEQEAAITQLKATVSKQEAIIAQQQRGMEAVTASLKEQASQIQKVSAQVELNKPAPQTVLNNQ